MMLFSGVFFPLEQLPPALQSVANLLPLAHAVAIARPLMNDAIPAGLFGHIATLIGFCIAGSFLALALTRRRLLK
jgi:lipooligosaccharide transport system permease protein